MVHEYVLFNKIAVIISNEMFLSCNHLVLGENPEKKNRYLDTIWGNLTRVRLYFFSLDVTEVEIYKTHIKDSIIANVR